MIGWIVAGGILAAWIYTAVQVGQAMEILKSTISTLADKALAPENAERLKNELGIK